ncbi:major histocompatibility complex class I-related gene protein [Protobothrops mucrosquamatus]|uniref:major histocompatibility complex class I-related gene protein n=1 Tax=Protobothrops mucrosquamatus TaxID=103944 RepID=UPI000775FADF|nr:major histocompatibility complex class I-related gene protein [Protobothrops mucrosquamatus]
MGLLQWRLWLVGATTFLLGNASGTASRSHSLLHFRHAVLFEGRPQFVEVTYLDSQPIQRYDSSTKIMRPLTPWMNQTLNEDYWLWESIMGNLLKDNFLGEFQNSAVPQKHHNQSTDYSEESSTDYPDEDSLAEFQNSAVPPKHHSQITDHTLQCIQGCELTADGKEIEIHRDAVDGKEMKGDEIHIRYYMVGNCILWLKRYLNMKPQRKELPIVKVTHQEVSINNLQALTCQAYGFYPSEISVSWRKDGEIFNQTNSAAHIAPNSDGTFYARLSIQINPNKRKLYRCHVEHVSSSEPLDFVLQETGPSAKVTTHVLNVNDTRLNCSVCNFYPEDIEATWKKDGEFRDHENYRGDTIRNWDGTYCTWISIEINPMEEDRYCCYVGHDGLQEPLCVKALKLEIPNEENLIFILYYTMPVLGILILGIIGILYYKKCRRRDYRPAAKSDPNSSMDNAEKSPLKETEGIPPLNNTAGEESKGDSPPSQGIGEKKQHFENHQLSV